MIDLVRKLAKIHGHRSDNSNNSFRQFKFISFLLLIKQVILNDLENKKHIAIDRKDGKKGCKPINYK